MRSDGGWTGGQHSLWRGLLGVAVFFHFLTRLRPDQPVLLGIAVAGMLLACAVTIGLRDGWAAMGLVVLTAADEILRDRAICAPAFAVPLLLLAFSMQRPYGSLDRRGDPDPGSTWRRPYFLVLAGRAAFFGLAVAELVRMFLLGSYFLPGLLIGLAAILGGVSLSRALRPFAWLVGLLLLLPLAPSPFFAGLFFLYLFIASPAWIQPAGNAGVLYFDGSCGLCHGAVRFLLAESRDASLRVAPLHGPTFLAEVPEEFREDLPDSLVLHLTEFGAPFLKAEAVLRLAAALGGVWALGAKLAGLLPMRRLDAAYDFVASIRHSLFAKPKDACPVGPRDLRRRFLP